MKLTDKRIRCENYLISCGASLILNDDANRIRVFGMLDNQGFSVFAFKGNGANLDFKKRFSDRNTADNFISDWVESVKKQVEKKRNIQMKFKEGDVLVSIWGYEQSNVDFYQVTSVSSKTVRFRKIAGKRTGYENELSGKCVPVPGCFISDDEMTRRAINGEFVRINSFASASILDYVIDGGGNRIYRVIDWSSYA